MNPNETPEEVDIQEIPEEVNIQEMRNYEDKEEE